jgi:hypothetical protein
MVVSTMTAAKIATQNRIHMIAEFHHPFQPFLSH